MSLKILPIEQMHYEDEQVAFDDVIVTYVQSEDCTQNRDDVQSITLSTRNNGEARFINIKTDSWSISDIDDLAKIIDNFKQRAGLNES